MSTDPTLSDLRADALRLTLALAKHTDAKTAAATAGVVMFLHGAAREHPPDQRLPFVMQAGGAIVDAAGEEGLADMAVLLEQIGPAWSVPPTWTVPPCPG